MKEWITLILIAIALSMDTFSLSLGIGSIQITRKKTIFFSTLVGCMHFIMPLLGNFLGSKIVSFFTINSNFLLGIILIYLAITMFINLLKKEEAPKNINVITMFLLAIGVSIDSFSTGLGLSAITNNLLLSVIIFSITSASFTYLGLIIGKYATKILGTYANILGMILLFVLGILYLCK